MINKSVCLQGTVQGQCVLEDRQLAALTACLESNVVVVQAPPGCGKTFLAVKVTQVSQLLKRGGIGGIDCIENGEGKQI